MPAFFGLLMVMWKPFGAPSDAISQPRQIQFPIPGVTTFEAAFEIFDSCAQKHCDAINAAERDNFNRQQGFPVGIQLAGEVPASFADIKKQAQGMIRDNKEWFR